MEPSLQDADTFAGCQFCRLCHINIDKPSLTHVNFVLQNKHPHVIYEYADSSIQGCAVTEGFGGSGSPGGGGPLGGGGGGYGKRQVSGRH